MRGLIVVFGSQWIAERIAEVPHLDEDGEFSVKQFSDIEDLKSFIGSGAEISNAMIDFSRFEEAQAAFILLRCELPLVPVIAILPERESITEQSLIEVGAGDVISLADLEPALLRRSAALAQVRSRLFYSKERTSLKSQAIRIVSSSIIALLKKEIRDAYSAGENSPRVFEKRAISIGSLLEGLADFLLNDQDMLEGQVETFSFESVLQEFFAQKLIENPKNSVTIRCNGTLPQLLRGIIKPTLKIIGLLFSAISEFTQSKGDVEIRIFKEAQVGNEVKIFIRFLSGGLREIAGQRDEHPMEVITLITNDVLSRVGGGVFLEILSSERTSLSMLVPFELEPIVHGESRTLPRRVTVQSKLTKRSTRCLVVDDVPVNTIIGSTLLQRIGFAVDSAASGRSALSLAQETFYGFILLDIDMPEMNGIEACARLREIPKYSDAKIIAFSASRPTMDPELRSVGFDGCLPKPVIKAVLDAMTNDLA